MLLLHTEFRTAKVSEALVKVLEHVWRKKHSCGKPCYSAVGKKALAALADAGTGLATSGRTSVGWAGDAIFHKIVDSANKALEKRALKQGRVKAVDQRDLSRMMTAPRTLLKGEGEFETFGTQFGKVVEHLNAFVALNKKASLANCGEAYDLAFRAFEVQKHVEKATERESACRHLRGHRGHALQHEHARLPRREAGRDRGQHHRLAQEAPQEAVLGWPVLPPRRGRDRRGRQ
jgi:hypothetical protein